MYVRSEPETRNKKQVTLKGMADHRNNWRLRLHEVIFESNTPAGKAFDIALLICILGSIIVVSLDSVPIYHMKYSGVFTVIEWFFTILFTIEYILRLVSVRRPLKYAF